MKVYSRFICNFQNWETIKMHFFRRMDKLVSPKNRILFNDERKGAIKAQKDMEKS